MEANLMLWSGAVSAYKATQEHTVKSTMEQVTTSDWSALWKSLHLLHVILREVCNM